MTAPMQRIEVITRSERRRRWSIEEKREIVAESLGSGVRPSEIIQRHGITSGQLYAWRQQLTRRVDGQPVRPGEVCTSGCRCCRAGVSGGTAGEPVEQTTNACAGDRCARAKGLIEILLPGGTSVRVDGQVDERALRCVLDGIGAVI